MNPVMDAHEYTAERYYELFEDNMLLKFGKVKREYWQIYDAFKDQIEQLRINGIRPWNACFLILNGEDAFAPMVPEATYRNIAIATEDFTALRPGEGMWMPADEWLRKRIYSHGVYHRKKFTTEMYPQQNTMHVKRLA
jgi:hypothetical protein